MSVHFKCKFGMMPNIVGQRLAACTLLNITTGQKHTHVNMHAVCEPHPAVSAL